MTTKIRILYIDDYELDRELVRDSLEKEHGGFELLEASNRQEFEALLKKHEFDLVLSDFNIAGFEGLQVLDAVHAHDPKIPVIIVTGTGSEEIAAMALKQGASDYVIKRPSHIQRLPQTIFAAIEKQTLRDQRRQAEMSLQESEAKFRNIAESSLVGIYILQDDIFIYVNPKFAEIFGYSVEECLSKVHSNQLVYPEDLEMVKEQTRKNASGVANASNYSFRGVRKTGEIIHVEVFRSAIVINGKKASTGTLLDITQSKRDQDERRKSDQRLSLALDSVRDAIWDWQVDTNQVYFSSRWYTMLGYAPYELPQEFETWRKLLHPDDSAISEQTVFRHLESGEPFEIEFRMRTKDDQWRWILARGKTVEKNAQGKPVRMLGTHIDITQRKVLENQIQQSQKLESIGTLAGGIAHDFNNILSSIIGFTELALDDVGKDTDLEDSLQEIYSAAKRARDLVKQILSIGRKNDLEIKPIQLTPLIKEVIRMLRSTIPASIEIKESFPDASLVVKADANQLHQVFVNLATNAKHAMEGRTGIMEFGVDAVNLESDIKMQYPDMNPGRYARITVSDTGTGIPEKYLHEIFQPYFTTKDKETGTGLGLSVVQGIVKSHNGHITVYSEPGKGTTFHVYLPIVKKAGTVWAERKPEKFPTGKESIFLVDDEAAIVKMLQQNLERLGYAITARTSSIDALETFRASPDRFDLVITDMTMPHMTGDTLAQEIKAIRPDVPVILCTGFSEKINGTIEKLNIDGFFMKPMDIMKMAQTIRNVLDDAKKRTQR